MLGPPRLPSRHPFELRCRRAGPAARAVVCRALPPGGAASGSPGARGRLRGRDARRSDVPAPRDHRVCRLRARHSRQAPRQGQAGGAGGRHRLGHRSRCREPAALVDEEPAGRGAVLDRRAWAGSLMATLRTVAQLPRRSFAVVSSRRADSRTEQRFGRVNAGVRLGSLDSCSVRCSRSLGGGRSCAG